MIYKHQQITDPYFRRLRKGLRGAEKFLYEVQGKSPEQQAKAAGRWNRLLQAARKQITDTTPWKGSK